AEAPRARLPRHAAVERRYGVCGAQDLRSRSLAAGAEHLSRNFELLELPAVPGAPHEGALSPGRRQRYAAGASAERLRSRRRAHLPTANGAGAIPEALQPYRGGQKAIGEDG